MQKKGSPLAAAITKARQDKGMSTRQVAAEIGIDQSNLVRLEQGSVAEPKPSVLDGLAQVLELDVADEEAAGLPPSSSELPQPVRANRPVRRTTPPRRAAGRMRAVVRSSWVTGRPSGSGGPLPGAAAPGSPRRTVAARYTRPRCSSPRAIRIAPRPDQPRRRRTAMIARAVRTTTAAS